MIIPGRDQITFRQQLLDIAIGMLVTQGSQCMDSQINGCAYIGPPKPERDLPVTHCAAGWCFHIADLNAEYIVEGEAASDIINKGVSHKDAGATWLRDMLDNSAVLNIFQQLHDAEDRAEREYHARDLQENFGVDVSGDDWQAWIAMGEKYG